MKDNKKDSITKKELNIFFENSKKIHDKIIKNEDELIDLLTEYETHETALDEIQRSIDTIKGFRKEFGEKEEFIGGLTISTFFPLNLPLYSLVLFGIAPSAFSSYVFIRPPQVMHEILTKVWKFLDIDNVFNNIYLYAVPRNIFMDLYASRSDVLIFTGKYENAINVHDRCPQALLIYNGSGINPFLILENADIDEATDKAIEMRCFNSGQDCAGPDAFIVDYKISEKFCELLERKLKDVKVGDSKNKAVRVSKTLKSSYLEDLTKWLGTMSDKVTLEGKINKEKSLVSPYIIKVNATEHTGDFHEFFAPVFYVIEYKNQRELNQILNNKYFKQRSMYISVFGGNEKITNKLHNVKILRNKIVNDTERGNEEYGGWGPRSNFTLQNNKIESHPILISREMQNKLN